MSGFLSVDNSIRHIYFPSSKNQNKYLIIPELPKNNNNRAQRGSFSMDPNKLKLIDFISKKNIKSISNEFDHRNSKKFLSSKDKALREMRLSDEIKINNNISDINSASSKKNIKHISASKNYTKKFSKKNIGELKLSSEKSQKRKSSYFLPKFDIKIDNNSNKEVKKVENGKKCSLFKNKREKSKESHERISNISKINSESNFSDNVFLEILDELHPGKNEINDNI